MVSPTKNSPAESTGAHVTIVGNISKEELLRSIEENDGDNGLLNRFLWCCSRRSKSLPEGGRLWEVRESAEWRGCRSDSTGSGSVNRGVLRGIAKRVIYGDGTTPWGGSAQRIEPRSLRFGRRRHGPRPRASPPVEPALWVLDGADKIRREHLDAALAVWDYCEASARYIFGDALGDSNT